MEQLKSTTCKACEKEIKYLSKKPTMCSVCRTKSKAVKKKSEPAAGKPVKKPTYKQRPDNKNTQGELILFRALDELLKGHDFINHGYYSFLPSPKGYPLQLDRYYPDLKLGWEFDGKQHEEYNKYIHKSKKNFEYYKECDRLKELNCEAKGITLIRVAWNYKITPEALQGDILRADKALHDRIFRGKP